MITRRSSIFPLAIQFNPSTVKLRQQLSACHQLPNHAVKTCTQKYHLQAPRPDYRYGALVQRSRINMLSAKLLTLILGILPVYGSPSPSTFPNFVKDPTIKPDANVECPRTQQVGPIPVVWHRVEPESWWSKLGEAFRIGKKEAIARKQIAILNEDFKPVGVSFELISMSYSKNQAWYSQECTNDCSYSPDTPAWQMREALSTKNPTVLDIYCTGPQSFAPLFRYPMVCRRNGFDPHDGVVLPSDKLVGLGVPMSHGHHLTRLVGHWAGLSETYFGGCDLENDGISDTPAHVQEGPGMWDIFVCPTRKSACPGGLDAPLDNFMSDAPERCWTRFTPGQIRYMQQFLQTVRGVIAEPPSNRSTV